MSDEARGLTKWQLALAIGAGTAAIVGVSILAYVALRSERSSANPSPSGSPVLDASFDTEKDTTKRTEPVEKSALDRALEIKAEGNALFKQQKYEEAISSYKEAMGVCPPDNADEVAKFHQNIAAAYDVMAANAKDESEKISHLTSVMEHCSQALLLNPRYVKALIRRLRALEFCGKKKEALLDVTRVVILDESKGGILAETVTRLLKDISGEQAALLFPKLNPLAPNKLLIKTYLDSFVWKDDLSEERLRLLWVSHAAKSKKLDASPEQMLHEDQDPPPPPPAVPVSGEKENGFVLDTEEGNEQEKNQGSDEVKEPDQDSDEVKDQDRDADKVKDQDQGADEVKDQDQDADDVMDQDQDVDKVKDQNQDSGEVKDQDQDADEIKDPNQGSDQDQDADKIEDQNQGSDEYQDDKESDQDADEIEDQGSDDVKDQNQGSEEVDQGSDEVKDQDATTDQYIGFDTDPFVRAAAMFRNQKYHGILEVLTDAVENACPAFIPHAVLLRGTLYMLWRENEKALKDLEKLINMQGMSDEVIINCFVKKASIHAGSGDMDKVKSCFDKCLVIDRSSPDALIHRARVFLESPEDPHSFELVMDDLNKALVIAPGSAYASYSLATAYHRIAGMNQSMSMLSQASAKFEEAFKKFPKFVDGMILYALYLQDMSQFGKAEELLKKAMKMEPENSSVHFTMGILSIVSLHDPDKAAVCMEKAIAIDNSCIHAYDSLASLEIQKGNADRALELYDKAIQYSRSQAEMGQALVAREVISAQNQVCLEYNINMKELTARVMPS